MSIYEEMRRAGVELSSHESDLYARVCDESRHIVENYEFRESVQIFSSQIDGMLWYDIPFAFDPFWDRIAKIEAGSL